ncbi:hypothetical protein [Siccirubricoccus sp. G192]|uniref:hypothetical protein n=1 Tax=Siccirubricoccus sp. G192 TaxID=2849651 RepID=UPI001C2BF304|nr:hypothetical protein [Siccirubricoccus sp. G192]MBV1800471.1 hypothetical protein [Siccirubricoccus sp. G192]
MSKSEAARPSGPGTDRNGENQRRPAEPGAVDEMLAVLIASGLVVPDGGPVDRPPTTVAAAENYQEALRREARLREDLAAARRDIAGMLPAYSPAVASVVDAVAERLPALAAMAAGWQLSTLVMARLKRGEPVAQVDVDAIINMIRRDVAADPGPILRDRGSRWVDEVARVADARRRRSRGRLLTFALATLLVCLGAAAFWLGQMAAGQGHTPVLGFLEGHIEPR